MTTHQPPTEPVRNPVSDDENVAQEIVTRLVLNDLLDESQFDDLFNLLARGKLTDSDWKWIAEKSLQLQGKI